MLRLRAATCLQPCWPSTTPTCAPCCVPARYCPDQMLCAAHTVKIQTCRCAKARPAACRCIRVPLLSCIRQHPQLRPCLRPRPPCSLSLHKGAVTQLILAVLVNATSILPSQLVNRQKQKNIQLMLHMESTCDRKDFAFELSV